MDCFFIEYRTGNNTKWWSCPPLVTGQHQLHLGHSQWTFSHCDLKTHERYRFSDFPRHSVSMPYHPDSWIFLTSDLKRHLVLFLSCLTLLVLLFVTSSPWSMMILVTLFRKPSNWPFSFSKQRKKYSSWYFISEEQEIFYKWYRCACLLEWNVLLFLVPLCPVDSFSPWDNSKPFTDSSWTLSILPVEPHPAFFLPVPLIHRETLNLNPVFLLTYDLSELCVI